MHSAGVGVMVWDNGTVRCGDVWQSEGSAAASSADSATPGALRGGGGAPRDA